jgi:DNA-directed RNA polymerase subunit H
VPKHEILASGEAQTIFAKYNARPEQFPHVLTSDPVVKEIGAKAGDLVRIVRRSETAGATAYYRLVVESGL